MKENAIENEKQEITAEELIKKLTQDEHPDEEFSLTDTTITGKFDLRHRVVPVAISLMECTFTDEVDLGYCQFKQCVDFSGSCFEKDFNSMHAIYRKNIICNDSGFEGGADFNAIQCE